jgi:magnesium transporter
MRVFHVTAERFLELADLPAALPEQGFIWVGSARSELERRTPELQAALQQWGVGTIVDLHVSDLLNTQLPSSFDYTSWYDLMVFRRLAGINTTKSDTVAGSSEAVVAAAGTAQPIGVDSIVTSPVGFAAFDRVLVTAHSAECAVREYFAQRLAAMKISEARGSSARLPTSPADLMLRMINHMVDGYLDLRRQLSRQLGLLEHQLLDPQTRFNDWQVLLDSRKGLHLIEEVCEDQSAAVQEWIDATDELPLPAQPEAQRERELLRVRARDVLEHVQRVLSHVRRLEQSAETAVQMHFSALGHRTNDIMRTLTVLTAVFLPLNLITGFFGMNFEFMPLIHSRYGFWLAVGLMLAVALGLLVFFRRRHYLGRLQR